MGLTEAAAFVGAVVEVVVGVVFCVLVGAGVVVGMAFWVLVGVVGSGDVFGAESGLMFTLVGALLSLLGAAMGK